MNLDCDINWNQPSPNTVQLIATYSDLLNQLKLRKLNKRWKTIVDPIVFNQVPCFISPKDLPFIKRYGHYFDEAYIHSHNLEQFHLISKNCKNLSKLSITGIREIELCYETISKPYKHSLSYLSFQINEGDPCREDRSQLIQMIGNLKNLKTLQIVCFTNLHLPVFPQWNNITRLSLITLSTLYDTLLQSIENLKSLSDLDWDIDHRGNVENEPISYSFISLTHILDRANLKRLKLSIGNSEPNLPILKYYFVDQFQKLLFHERFTNLHTFNFTITEMFSIEDIAEFDQHLYPPSQQWTNLQSLKLPQMDPFLMTYIVQYFPNLHELYFKSPLFLPGTNDCLNLPPMVHLKYLTCHNFENHTKENPHVIRHLFPNVQKLHLTSPRESPCGLIIEPTLQSSEPTHRSTESSYLSMAFPNLKFLSFDSSISTIRMFSDQSET